MVESADFGITASAAVEIVNGISIRVEDAKRGRVVVVLVGIPEDVSLVEELTSDGSPEFLRIGHRWYCAAIVGARHGPGRLGHPLLLRRKKIWLASSTE